ncbi:MAG: radical SAM protein [Candidatus Odinarchaeia archaeon]
MTTKATETEQTGEEKVLDFTESLCPECWLEGNYDTLPATIFARDGKVYIKRNCKKHGVTEEIYWGSEELYLKMRKYWRDGPGIYNPFIKKKKIKCPTNCGYCNEHLSVPALGNLVVTNRCDLNCWYCFFFAERAGYVYEPTLEQMREMVRVFRSVQPVPGTALQITGGEPALRDDIVDIIKMIKEEGIRHVQFNTDGIRLAFDKTLARRIRDAGVNTIYLSFDGTTPVTNPKNHWEVRSNCYKLYK